MDGDLLDPTFQDLRETVFEAIARAQGGQQTVEKGQSAVTPTARAVSSLKELEFRGHPSD